MSEEKKNSVTLRFEPGSEEGKYANAISVHINGNETVLDFAYKMPKMSAAEETTLKVVSRVNMSHNTAESLLKLLSNAILDYKNKKKEVKN